MRLTELPSLYIMSRFLSLWFGGSLKDYKCIEYHKAVSTSFPLKLGASLEEENAIDFLRACDRKALKFLLFKERTLLLRKATCHVRSSVFLRSQCRDKTYIYSMVGDRWFGHSRLFRSRTRHEINEFFKISWVLTIVCNGMAKSWQRLLSRAWPNITWGPLWVSVTLYSWVSFIST